MIYKGAVVEKVSITKTDNVNDQDYEGYEITLTINGEDVEYFESTIDELEDQPYGIYEYIDNKYIQIENWEE